MQPHQLRVLREHSQLSCRIGRLSAFLAALGNPSAPQVGEEERALMWRQLRAMRAYQDVLALRIKGFQ